MDMPGRSPKNIPLLLVAVLLSFSVPPAGRLRSRRTGGLSRPAWESRLLHVDKAGKLQYIPDEKGNILPDFSRVGYEQGDQPVPDLPVVKTVSPSGDAQQAIQS